MENKRVTFWFKDEVIGVKSVAFKGDTPDKSSFDNKKPKEWDKCSWDDGELLSPTYTPKRKKRKVEVVEEPEIHEEITDETSE